METSMATGLATQSERSIALTKRINDSLIAYADSDRIRNAGRAIIKLYNEITAERRKCLTREDDFAWRQARIFLSGLFDFVNLSAIVLHTKWLCYPRAVEKAWRLAQEFRMRKSECCLVLNEDFSAHLAEGVNDVISAINAKYGEGVYTSPEIVCDYYSCSICRNDIRSCEHIPGRFYDWERCSVSPVNSEPRMVCIVKNPKDLRARIWPWMRRPDSYVIEDVPILLAFDPEGGTLTYEDVVDLRRLFAGSQGATRQRKKKKNSGVIANLKFGKRGFDGFCGLSD